MEKFVLCSNERWNMLTTKDQKALFDEVAMAYDKLLGEVIVNAIDKLPNRRELVLDFMHVTEGLKNWIEFWSNTEFLSIANDFCWLYYIIRLTSEIEQDMPKNITFGLN